MSKELQIRNSTVDFLVFTRDAGEDGIEVRVQDDDVWLTQKAISQLFNVDRSVVTKHLKNIFKKENWMRNQLVQILHKLPITEKDTNISFIHYQLLLLWDIVLILRERLSLELGQQKF